MATEEHNYTANKIFWSVFIILVFAGIAYSFAIGNLQTSEAVVVTVLCALSLGGLAYMDINPAFHHPPEQK
jgi:protein-S-isoprenylcysteine O-methyltransferase Ste14